MLSREEAVRKHRAMWNWIGSMLKSGLWRNVIDTSMSDPGLILEDPNALSVCEVIILLKYAYIHMIGDGHISSSCYVCDYTAHTFGSCLYGTLCPIIWPNIAKSSLCSYSLYYLIRYEATSFKEAGDIAFEIANLPERRVIHEKGITKK